MKNLRILAALLVLMAFSLMAGARERTCFDRDWRFVLADSAQMSGVDYDDSHWRQLDLPHDWAIEGDFHVDNKSGASGGALPGGVAWYRKHFTIEEWNNDDLQFLLEFDGVYMNSTVYVNGQKVGNRPYGYSSFEYDITPYVKAGDNVVAVRVDNGDQPNSRWYSGCGIYRHVWFTKTSAVRVAHWGTHVETDYNIGSMSFVYVEVKLENPLNKKAQVVNSLIDREGRVAARSKGLRSRMRIRHPFSWSCDDPYIYTVRTEVTVGGKVVDQVETTTGFRAFYFDRDSGFRLNNVSMKLNGVCLHHDLGCLGAAIHEDALHRQLLKLKQMGCNAIRCSHNPPAPELLNMCDTMGFIVMDESFDMWRRRKTQNDYARFFDEWAERDLTDMVLRDRNHPSILVWSVGNEVLEQWTDAGADTLSVEQANLILNAAHDASSLSWDSTLSINSVLTRRLVEIVRRNDTSRPITAGCNEPSPNNHLFKSDALDIIGYNYHHEWVKDVPRNFPDKPFLFTESVSALQTRGFYKMPSDSIFKAPRQWWLPYTDPTFMCSAYDNMHASWSSTHEEMWDVVKHTPYVAGQFIWTGWDYIGEPTPYGFPARSSYFGIIDLAGFPKDVYYMYQSEWTRKPVLHLFPHWNWMPGQQVDLWCYYNKADEVELFVNGRSQGVRRKGEHDYHVWWRVDFEPGEVKVVARKNGQVVGEQTRKTAGAPAMLRLAVDYQGSSLTFVNVDVTDAQGILCPLASDQLYFTASDGLEIVATDNGCQTSMERFQAPQRKAFHGRCMVVVRGKGTLTASGMGLTSQSININ